MFQGTQRLPWQYKEHHERVQRFYGTMASSADLHQINLIRAERSSRESTQCPKRPLLPPAAPEAQQLRPCWRIATFARIACVLNHRCVREPAGCVCCQAKALAPACGAVPLHRV
jgi:hypothetical protein